MTCCIIAMLIIAHVTAVLRRWGIFWGVVRPVEGEDSDTIYHRALIWLGKPRVRAAVLGLVAVEAFSVGTWLYVEHGTHIHRLGDQAVGAIRGQTIVYADVCGKDGSTHTVRVVIDGSRTRATETVI